jgi:hypothetical protein
MNGYLGAALHRAAVFLFPPTGEHRLTAPRPAWPAAPGTAIPQAIAWCGVCRMELPGTVHGTVFRCPQGHQTAGVSDG